MPSLLILLNKLIIGWLSEEKVILRKNTHKHILTFQKTELRGISLCIYHIAELNS